MIDMNKTISLLTAMAIAGSMGVAEVAVNKNEPMSLDERAAAINQFYTWGEKIMPAGAVKPGRCQQNAFVSRIKTPLSGLQRRDRTAALVYMEKTLTNASRADILITEPSENSNFKGREIFCYFFLHAQSHMRSTSLS